MSLTGMFEQYIAAFNSGDSAAYAGFYAPGVVFRNGAGVSLTGPKAIVDYYAGLKSSMRRKLEVRGVAEGECCLAAALASQFTILEPGLFFGEMLGPGDEVELESIALYELAGAQFARIEATTLSRRIRRAKEN